MSSDRTSPAERWVTNLQKETFNKMMTDEASVTKKGKIYIVCLIDLLIHIQLHVGDIFDDLLSIGSREIGSIQTQEKTAAQLRRI